MDLNDILYICIPIIIILKAILLKYLYDHNKKLFKTI
jgi:hypothetical protein